jgi:hypothetical protein
MKADQLPLGTGQVKAGAMHCRLVRRARMMLQIMRPSSRNEHCEFLFERALLFIQAKAL